MEIIIKRGAREPPRPRNPHKHRKKWEFSQKWLFACILISVLCTATSFVLSGFDKNPVEELSKAVIETLWGASSVSFLGYAVQNSVRSYVAGKFNLYDKLKKDEEEKNADDE